MNLEDLLVEDYPELSDTPPPEAKRGVVGEVVTGLKRGATVHLPAMIGQVGKWFSEPGALMYEAGESLNTEAQIRGSHPDRQLQPEAHGMVTNSLAGGAEMLVPSVGPQVVAVLGDVLFPPAAPYFHGMAAAGTGTLYGASQAQDTYERVLEATGDKSKAQMAGLASGTIEAGGEALASYIGGKYLTGALKFLGPKNGVKVAERVLAKARNPKALAAFGTSTVMNAATEVGTEMGQNAGEIAVERAAGVQEGPTPWEAAKEAVSPTLGMSALMLPLGGVGSYRANRQTQKMLTWLEDAEVPVEKRSQAAAFFHNEIAQQDQEAADQWAAATLTAIGEGRPLQVMDSGETKAGPLSKAVEKIAPQQVVAEPVDAVPVEQETGAAERSGYAIPLPDEEPMSEAEDWNARFDEGLARSIEGEDVEEGIDDLSGMRQEVGGPAPEVPAVRGAAVEPAVAEEFARVDDEQGSLPTPMDAQAHEAASSPANDSMEPTPAQIEAGNYKKGHLRLHGLDISIENPAGSVRKGTDETGRAWEQELSHHYGYIKGTVGPDKDHIDVFIKPGIDQSTAGDAVFVVDQKNLKNGRFDEPKVMVGYGSEEEARQAYLANYDGSGPKRIMDVTPTSVEDFRAWLQKGDTKKAFAGQAEKAKVREEPAEAVAEPLTKPIKLNFMVLQRQARQGELKISKKQADGSYSITGLADGVVKHRAENLAGVYAYLNGESDGAAQRQEEVQPPAVEGTPAEIDSRLDRQPTFDKKTQPGAVGAASTLDAELADLDTDDLSAMFDEVVQERRDEPAGTTLLEAQNMLIGLRTQVEKQGRVVDDRLLESEEEQSKVEDNPDEWRKEYRRKYADEGGHFASGYADFNKGLPRKLPPCYIVRKGKNPGNWFRGWDAANQDKTGVKSQVKPETRPATQKPVPSAAQSASKIAAEAAKHGVKGVDEAMKGLVDLFGGADSLKSFPSGLSRDTYEQAKPHFQKALQEFRTAGKGVKDFMRFIVENFSAKVKPYLMYFLEEVKSGDIVNSREVETEKENTDDRIEGTGTEKDGQPVRDDREGTAGDGDSASARVEPEAAQGPEGVESTAAADPESGGAGAQGDQRSDGQRVSKARSRRSGTARVHSDQTGRGSGSEDRGRRDLEAQGIPASNYRIPNDFKLGRGEAAKYADNLAAVRILKTLQKEKRLASAEEQQTLARYVGWGGLANAFRKPDGSMAKGWESKVEELEGLLTDKELEVARNSTQFAHYTSKEVVDGLWKIAQHLGFKGGNVLEPAMGVGNFVGMVPDELAARIHFTGVEYDPLTAGIAAALYPQSNVVHSGFEKIPLPPDYFDFVIGNPPFSQNSLRFKYTPVFNRFSMHNQFMLAGLEALKPGGVQAFVVSRYFLDAKSKEARAKISEKADLVAAFRLPDTAFKANAGTEVITDIILLQKKVDTETSNNVSWLETAEVSDPLGGEPITVNEYFKENPRNIVGTLDRSGSQNMHSNVNVHLDKDVSLADILDARIQSLPRNIISETTPQDRAQQAFEDLQSSISIALRGGEIGNVIFNDKGELTQVYEKEAPGGGELYAERVLTADSPWHNSLQQNEEGKWYEVVDKLDAKGKPVKMLGPNGKPTKLNQKEQKVYESEADVPATKKLGQRGYDRLKGAVKILDLLVRQIDLENTLNASSRQIEANRNKLKRAYQAFVKEHDYMNASKMLRIVDALPNGALLRSLEAKYKAPISKLRAKTLGVDARGAIVTTADILDKRIVYPYETPTSADNATDALAVVLSESGGVDMDRIAELTGQSVEEVVDELHTSAGTPVIFKDPETGLWETADEYLGGNVVRKLMAAKQAEMEKNVAALEKVQPEPWTADKVTVSLGATWVPGKVYAKFVEHLTGAPGTVHFSRVTNTFAVTGSADTATAKGWNTPARSAVDLLGNILNSQAIKVTRTVDMGGGQTRTYVDTEATQAANDMAETIKEEFADWVFRDSERRRDLVDLFNRKFNVRVTKQRNGSHLKFPGKVPDHIIQLHRHQVNGIWRGIVDRFVLYDHTVGSGKTFTAIARAIERRRMGLSKKPMMVVPNHILEQVAKDVYTLYPGAKVLAAGTKDLSKNKRKRLFARIATGDWDLVIVPHSSFQFIGISPDTEERFLQEELQLAIEAVEEAEEEAAAEGYEGYRKPLTVKEAERLRDNVAARLEKVKERAAKRDNLLTFEQMGIDDLTVDESHEFKNLFYYSKLNVRGMNPKAGSAKAYDLWSKVRVLRESKNGSVAFMTGTPVSNSAVELYGIMRYLAADALEEMGLEHFDAWRSQFASVTTAFEPKESGRGLKEVNRIGRDWSNMRSLMDLYYSFADVVSNEDIKQWYAEDNDGAEFPIPKVKGGGRRSVNVDPSSVQEGIIEQIVQGFDALPDIEDVDQRNAERLRLMDRARKVSLDARAVDPHIQDNGEGGKLAAVAVEVRRLYEASQTDKGTQLIFLDRSVPKAKGDAAKIGQYDSLVRQLEQAEQDGDEAKAMKLSDQLEKYDHDEMASLKAAQQGGWNAYDEIKKRLIESGIPADEIRYVQEASTDDQKKLLFEEVNAGKVRILLGSTPRMGAGTNVQERLVGLHHVDVTWKPSDIEQREGRIIRQGNRLLAKYGDRFEVEILAYTTNRTVDAKLWSLNATKLRMINGLRHYTGDFNIEFDDSDSVGMAEIAAIASGEPLQLERVQLTSEIDKLNRQKRAHQRRVYGMRDELDDHRRALRNEAKVGAYEKHAGALAGMEAKARRRTVTIAYGDETHSFGFEQHSEAKDVISELAQSAAENKQKFRIHVDGKRYTSKTKAQDAVQKALGDGVAFDAAYGGGTFISRTGLDKAIAQKAASVLREKLDAKDSQAEMDETPLGSVTFDGGLDVQLSAQVTVGGQMGGNEQVLEVFAEAEEGETWLVNDSVMGVLKGFKDLSDITRGLSRAIVRRVRDFSGTAEALKAKADKARAMIPKLESLVDEPFQKEQELAEKQKRLEEVENELASGADQQANEPPKFSVARSAANKRKNLDMHRSLMTGDSGLGNVTVTPAKPLPYIRRLMERENLEQVVVKGGHVDAVREVAEQFGKTIVFFRERDTAEAGRDATVPVSPGSDGAGQVRRSEEDKGIVGGFLHPGRPDRIYVNVQSPSHVLFVTGHELGHALRVEDPALWEEMATKLRPLIERWGEYRETLSDAHYAELSEDEQFEELVGDVIGTNFLNEKFWQEMAEANESLFRRIARKAISLLNKALRLLAGHQDVTRYVSDMTQARAIIAKTLLAYGQKARAGMYEKFAAQEDTDYLAERIDGHAILARLKEQGIGEEELTRLFAGGTKFFAGEADLEVQVSVPLREARTFSQARQAAEDFRRTDLTNAATGLVARVSRNSLDKMLNGKAVNKSESPQYHSLAVANLDILFERAISGWSKPDRAVDPNIAAIHRFFAPIDVGGKILLAKITVKETADVKMANRLYSVESVEFNEKSPAAQWVDAAADADGIDLTSIRSARDIRSIAQQIENYNVEKQRVSLDADVRFAVGEASKKFVSKLTPDKAGLVFQTLSDMLPERMKAAVGSVLSNPHYGAKKSKYRGQAYDLALERGANANEIKYEVMAQKDGYEGLEGLRDHYSKAGKAEREMVDTLLVEGDIRGEEYAEEDLDGEDNALGRAVPEVVKRAYLAFRQTISHATATMFDRLGRLRLLPYEDTAFYQELVDLLDAGLSSAEVARRFGIHEKAVAAYRQIMQGRTKLDAATRPYKNQAWYSTLRDALLKGISGIEMQNEFGKTPDLVKAFYDIMRQNPNLKIATAEQFKKARWYKTLADLLTVGDDHPMLQKVEIYNAYRGVQDYDSKLAELKAQWGERKGYLPRIRKDDEQHVKVFAVEDDGTYREVWMQSAKSKTAAKWLKERVEKNLKDYIPHSFDPEAHYKVVVEPNTATPEEIFLGIGSHRAIEALLSKVFDKATDAGIIENHLQVQQQVLSILADEISARGFGRHRISRAEHLIEGYETQNTPAILAQFVGGMAGWLSKSEFAMRANKLMTNIPADKPQDKVWVRQYVDDALKNSTYIDQWLGTARSFAALMYLGFKTSSAMLNATQNYIWGQAKLSEYTKGATRKLLRAQHDVIKDHLLRKAGKPGVLTEEEAWVLEEGLRRGRSHANYVRAMAGMDDTGGVLGKGQAGIRWLTEKAMIPFQAVETYWNREPALLAAYRVFKAQGMDQYAALKKAEHFVDDVHFVVGKENIPAVLRKLGPLGRTLYTFQSYTHNYLLGLLTSLGQGDFHVVMRSMTALVLFGGLAAVPFGDDLDKWYRRMFGERPLRMLDKWLRGTAGQYTDFGDQIADFVLHGAPALAGVNFSRAIAVNVPWLSPEDESLAERVTGVWGGLAQKVRYAGSAASRGDFWRAAEYMSPEALANILRAYRHYADGATTLSGRPVFGDDGRQVRYTAKEGIVRAFGFMPLEPSKQSEARWDARLARDFWQERKSDVLARFRTAKDRKAALKAVRDFNRALREAPGGVLVPPITPRSLRQALRARPDWREMVYRR